MPSTTRPSAGPALISSASSASPSPKKGMAWHREKQLWTDTAKKPPAAQPVDRAASSAGVLVVQTQHARLPHSLEAGAPKPPRRRSPKTRSRRSRASAPRRCSDPPSCRSRARSTESAPRRSISKSGRTSTCDRRCQTFRARCTGRETIGDAQRDREARPKLAAGRIPRPGRHHASPPLVLDSDRLYLARPRALEGAGRALGGRRGSGARYHTSE